MFGHGNAAPTSKNIDLKTFGTHAIIDKLEDYTMSIKTISYTRELESLIQNVLLPAYDKYYRDKGMLPPYTSAFPKGLLNDVIKPKRECVLFKPRNPDLK